MSLLGIQWIPSNSKRLLDGALLAMRFGWKDESQICQPAARQQRCQRNVKRESMKKQKAKATVAKVRATGIDPTRLINVSDEGFGLPNLAEAAYVDRERGVCVQIWLNATPGCKGTPWQGTLRVAVKHTRATSVAQMHQRGLDKPVTWDDMQAIKDHFWPDRIAVEVYPPRDKIVDVADMRWMWVLPS